MIETLNEFGYVIDFDVLNSKYFGVPQNRERIFIVAVRADLIEAEPFSEESTKGNTIVPKGKRRIGEWANVFNFDWPEQAEVTTRLRDILEPTVDDKYYLDEEKTAKLVAQLETKEVDSPGVLNIGRIPKWNQRGNVMSEGGISKSVTAVDYKMPPIVKHSEPLMLGHVDIRGNDSIKRTYSTEGISPTLTTMGGGHRETKIAEEQGLPIREATKKGYAIAQEGGSVNVQFPDSKTRRGRVGKQIANTLEASSINQGVVEKEEVRPVLTPDRMEKRQNGRRFKEDGEESFTLTSQDKHGVAIGSPPKYRIRKLTPLECFRLQNFPDEAHQKLVEVGISHSQRYKMAGNAVTVSVVEAIAKNLLPLIVGGGTGFEESETSS